MRSFKLAREMHSFGKAEQDVLQLHALHFHILLLGPYFSCSKLTISCPAISVVCHFHVRHLQSIPTYGGNNFPSLCWLVEQW